MPSGDIDEIQHQGGKIRDLPTTVQPQPVPATLDADSGRLSEGLSAAHSVKQDAARAFMAARDASVTDAGQALIQFGSNFAGFDQKHAAAIRQLPATR